MRRYGFAGEGVWFAPYTGNDASTLALKLIGGVNWNLKPVALQNDGIVTKKKQNNKNNQSFLSNVTRTYTV